MHEKLTVKELIELLQKMDQTDELVRNLGTGVYVSYVGYDIDKNEIVII